MKKNRDKIINLLQEEEVEQSFDWRKELPKEIIEWALDEIKYQVDARGLYYDDNYRIAEVGELEQERAYSEIQNNGCCGFSDFTMKGPDDKLYMIGFNYGH